MRNTYKALVGKPKGNGPFEDLAVGGRITLEWILTKYCGKLWTGFIWRAGSYEHDNETWGSIKGGEFLG
jgi:hypothetical protein